MELILGLIAIVVVGSLIYFNRSSKGFDVNNDGKVDVADAKAAVANTVAGVTASADVNKDGVINIKDAAEVAVKAKKTVKKATSKVTKTKPAAKKVAAPTRRGRKPKSV